MYIYLYFLGGTLIRNFHFNFFLTYKNLSLSKNRKKYMFEW